MASTGPPEYTVPMKLLLLHMPLERGNLDMPLAAARLKAVLDADPALRDLKTEIGTLYPGETYPNLPPDTDMLGLSLYCWNRHALLDLTARYRASRPGLRVIAGGPEAQCEPETIMDQADYLIAGEGEEALAELMGFLVAGTEPASYPWLMRSKQDPPPVPAPPVSFASLPSPFLSASLPGPFSQVLWEVTRGCPHRCAFCFESRGNRSVRSLNRDRLRLEGEWIKESGAEEVFLLDPTFNYNRRHCLETLEELIALEADCHFTFEVRMEQLDEASLERFSQLSCALQIGLQSASEKICRNINRPLDRKAFRQGARLLRKYDQAFGLDLIYGLPGDSLRGFRESLNFALELQPSNLEIFPLQLIRGTELFDRAPEWGIREGDSDFRGWEHPSFPSEDMRTARDLAAATEEMLGWALCTEWLPVIHREKGITPGNWMEAFRRWKETHPGQGPESFCEESLGDDTALRDLIRLHRGFQLLQEEESVLVELWHSPDELDSNDLPASPGSSRRWLLYCDEDGLCWEEGI